MDTIAARAEFVRNLTESHRIIALLRAEACLNSTAIDESRKAIDDTRDMLNFPDGDGNC